MNPFDDKEDSHQGTPTEKRRKKITSMPIVHTNTVTRTPGPVSDCPVGSPHLCEIALSKVTIPSAVGVEDELPVVANLKQSPQ